MELIFSSIQKDLRGIGVTGLHAGRCVQNRHRWERQISTCSSEMRVPVDRRLNENNRRTQFAIPSGRQIHRRIGFLFQHKVQTVHRGDAARIDLTLALL